MSNQPKIFADGIHDDTIALQFLLDHNDGTVTLPAGTYLISDTLRIHDDTHLILAHKATVRLAADASCIMLANDRWMRPGRNHNIIVEGGTWDGNNLEQKRGKVSPEKPFFRGIVLRFEGIKDLTVRNITFRNPEAYACQIMDGDRFTVENITFDFNMAKPNMDGIHVQGPARNGFIRNIKGATNDDLVALNCDDYYEDWDKHILTQGDIENVTVDGLYADNGYTAVRLLSCGSTLKNVTIRNVFGTYRVFGISFTHHNIFPGKPIWFDGITIDGVYCTKQPQTPPVDRKYIDGLDKFYGAGIHDELLATADIIWFESNVQCGNVAIRNVYRDEKTVTQAYTIHMEKGTHIDHLTLQNINQNFANCPAQPIFFNEGTIDRLVSDLEN